MTEKIPNIQELRENDRALYIKVREGKVCPYCLEKPVLLEDSSEVYGGRNFGPVYVCKPCDAMVGVHKGSKTPKGMLAKKGLRELRKRRTKSLIRYGRREGCQERKPMIG